MPAHITLLGDSIFDNAAYTGGEPDVVAHLRDLLSSGSKATLCAVDGSTTADLMGQLKRVPADTSHVVLSIGGNDALLNSDLLGTPVRSTGEALARFAKRVSGFEMSYRAAVDGVLALDRDTTICTIYNGNLESIDPTVARVALMLFNDVILRVAFEHKLRVIDLRLVCTEPSDYVNQIEPSGRGGRKIAEAIARSLGTVDAGRDHAQVYAG